MSYKKHNFKSGQTLYAAQLNEMDEQIALMDIALSNLSGDGTDLSDYSLIGNTPQILSGSNTEYSIILDATEETTVSIISDTITDLESSNNIRFQGCSETYSNGIYTIECQSTSAWYSAYKELYMYNLLPGNSYTLLYDVTDVIQSNTVNDGYYAHLTISDGATESNIVSQPLHINGSIKSFGFTALSESIIVRIYTTDSSHSNQIGNKICYRDIWVNNANAREKRTKIYKLETVINKTLILNNIMGGITITTTPSVPVYTLTTGGNEFNDNFIGKTCVCFGDSITGNYSSPLDYPSIIARNTGMNVINGGFGGCRMAQHPSTGYTAFSMYSLANSIASGDWSVQDTGLELIASANAAEHLANLKAVDWSTVDYITIFYGTNDFTGGVPIGEEPDSLSTSQYKGAMRHSIETILAAYPKIRIVLLTPIYRFWTEDGIIINSDSKENAGRKLTDYVKAVLDIAEEYKLPVFNLYNTLGINKINCKTFLADGVHPSENGLERIGSSIAQRLLAI